MDDTALQQIRTELQHDLDELRSTLAELPAGPDDPVAQMLRASAVELERALTKLAQNRYGPCESCHKPIPDQRLSMLPASRWCQKCEDERP